MDESKRYTIQVKGTAYRFAPLDLEHLGRVELLNHMDVSPSVTVKAVMGLLKRSLGDAEWDALATRFVSGDVPLTELKTVLEKLAKRTAKDAPAASDSDDGE
jgi:hypothetical protein